MEGIILSSWDYIMGPQIERLWFMNFNPEISSFEVPVIILKDFNISKNSKQFHSNNELHCQYDLKMYSFMCGQLLLGEMDIPETVDENISRLYISDLKILISIVFRMKSWIYTGTIKEVKNVSLCIGLICKREAFNFVLRNQLTIDSNFRTLADILQNRKCVCESVFVELSENVLHVISLLNSLYHTNTSQIQNNRFSPVQDFSISNILPTAIVSHLQTSGRTAVLAGSEVKFKQIINILSLFNNEGDMGCSFLINRYPLKCKVSAFYIQGIVKNSEKDFECLLEHAYDESLSLTVIDIDHCKVWQTYPFHTNFEKNRVFSPVTETGCIIPQLLNDLSFANKNDINCQTLIQNFTKLLMMKATNLVKTVMHFRDVKRILSKQELMAFFAIYSLVDLQIILGYAEKIKPGIRCLIL